VRARVVALGALAVLAGVSCGPATATSSTIKVGAVFPLSGAQAPLARQEYTGAQIARDFVNADGGVQGKPIELVTRDITTPGDGATRVKELQSAGVHSILGAYSSALSMPISEAAQADGLLYWEAGAVADQLTGRGYPLVFRVGATGGNLGAMSSHFAATVLASRLQQPASSLRVALVHNLDAYPMAVAAAVAQQARKENMPVVADVSYDANAPDWGATINSLRAANPDILMLSSYIDDGVRFRRAMLASGLHVKALIGTTMAQCVPDFGVMLGADANGVFASDRPPHGFNPAALNPIGHGRQPAVRDPDAWYESASNTIFLTFDNMPPDLAPWMDAVRKLLHDKFTIGAEATAAAGPLGREASAQTDAQMRAEILSYSRSRGLFAGLAIQGATLRPDPDADRRLYGRDITNSEILTGNTAAPPEAAKLEGLLNRNSMHKQ